MFSHVQFCLIPNHCHFQGVIITIYKHWVGSSGFMVRVRKARDPNQSNNKGSFWNCSVYTQNRAYMQTTEWKWLPQLVFWHLSLASSTCTQFLFENETFFLRFGIPSTRVSGENGHRKRIFSKTLSRVEIFELTPAFHLRMDGRKRRFSNTIITYIIYF